MARPAERLRIKPFEHSEQWDVSGLRQAPDLDLGRLERGVDPRLPTVTDPSVVPTASLGLGAPDWVIGVVIDSEARAYPISLLKWYHLINDRAGSRILVTFCASCGTGICYDPVIDGVHLTFELFGRYQGNMTMRDDETGTVWSQMTGDALVGELVGRSLTMLPSETVTAPLWLRQHPNSTSPRVPDPGGGRSAGNINDLHPRTQSTADDPLVVGVTLDQHAVAYRVDSSLDRTLCMADDLGGEPIVLLGASGWIPVAYSRRVNGDIIDLFLDKQSIRDDGGSTWSIDGRCVDGPRKGESLTRLESHTASWMKWQVFHPASELRSMRNPGSRPD